MNQSCGSMGQTKTVNRHAPAPRLAVNVQSQLSVGGRVSCRITARMQISAEVTFRPSHCHRNVSRSWLVSWKWPMSAPAPNIKVATQRPPPSMVAVINKAVVHDWGHSRFFFTE